MIRIVLENIFFFLLPTIGYVAYIAFRHNTWPGLVAVLAAAPLVRLFIAGAVIMLATLTLLSSRSHNKPSEAYQPPVYRDGQLQPARRLDAPVAPENATPEAPETTSPNEPK